MFADIICTYYTLDLIRSTHLQFTPSLPLKRVKIQISFILYLNNKQMQSTTFKLVSHIEDSLNFLLKFSKWVKGANSWYVQVNGQFFITYHPKLFLLKTLLSWDGPNNTTWGLIHSSVITNTPRWPSHNHTKSYQGYS